MLRLKVTDIGAESKGVVAIELRAADGSPLPAYAPGAHLEFHLPNGLVRHYSLTGDSREHDCFRIAVLRVPDSRGGSMFMHRELSLGRELDASLHNNFPLDPDAAGYIFVAGGIGITPIISMIRWCIANCQPWQLFYSTRNRARTAFYEELGALSDGLVHWHFDDEAGGYMDVDAALAEAMEGEQVYCCGPRPLMSAMRAAALARHMVVRFESFLAPQSEQPAGELGDGERKPAVESSGEPFQIILKRSGVTLDVPADKSILQTLEAHGIAAPSSCREGQCGTCTQRVLDGVPDHRDYVLTPEERAANDCIQVCVSRSLTPSLTLDL